MKQLYPLLLLLLTFFVQPVLGQPGEQWLDGWDQRIQIEIDHEKVDSELTGYPVAVKLDVSNFDFSLAGSDGSDIRFTDADGLTTLPFEREIHGQAQQQAVYWVRIPTVANIDSNTVFFIYYGNSGASDAADNSGAVWDTGLRGAVWHMDHEETDGSWLIYDSRHNNRGVKEGEVNPGQVTGIIGYAQKFDGNNDKVTVSHDVGEESINITNAITLSAWVRPEMQTPLLNQAEGAVAAYSLRKMSSDYTGAAIRVRNSDNQEADIGFNIEGNLDVDALLGHTGTGPGNHGYVVTWYDQSGNSDVTQSIAANQPMIVENGEVLMSGGNPMVRFDNDFLDGTVNMGSQNPDVTLNAVWRQTGDGTASEVPVFLGNNNDQEGLSIQYLYMPPYMGYPEFKGNIIRLWQWDYITVGSFTAELKVQTGTYDNIDASSSVMQVFIDGNSSTAKTDAGQFDVGTGFENTPITIGANQDGADYLKNSFVAEIVVYNKVLSAEEREEFEGNQLKCYGFNIPVIAGKGRDAYQLEFSGQDFIGYINGDTIVAPGNLEEYQHVAMTYDQTNLKLFINGNEVRSKPLTNPITTNSKPLVIGELFKGIIDEVRVSNTARSNEWILADYHSGTGDLIVFDQSGFDIVDPGPQIAGVPFDIGITNASGFFGDDLEGSFEVTVTSSNTNEGAGEDGVVFSGELIFASGVSAVPDVLIKTADIHTLTISIDGVSSDETIDIEVGAANAHAIVFITAEHLITANETTGLITIQLQDEYGNVAESSGETTIILGSDMTGTFRNEANDADITFVTIPDKGSQASFLYTSTVAGTHVLSVTDNDEILVGDSQTLTVNAGEPYRIVFITEEQIVSTGEASEIITIQLEDYYGNVTASDGSVSINLSSSHGGVFRDQDDFDDLPLPYTIGNGQSEVSFRFRPTDAETHMLSVTDAAAPTVLEGDTQELIAVDFITWTGNTNVKWENSGNWDPERIPTENDYIIIPAGSPEIDDEDVETKDVTVRYLDIKNGAKLLVNHNGSLTVKDGGRVRIESGGQLTNNGPVTLDYGGRVIIHSEGNWTANGDIVNNNSFEGLLIESDASGTGSLILANTGVAATVQRWVAGGVWVIVSPPVSGMTIGDFLLNYDNKVPYNSNLGVHAMAHYDEGVDPNGAWSDYYATSDHDSSLEPGKSYLVRRGESGVFTFAGNLTPDITGLSIERTVSGWNSLGNPFTSALRIRDTEGFLLTNASELDESYAVLYIYDPDNPAQYSIIGNAVPTDLEGRPVIDQDFVKPGQGFLIMAKDLGGAVNFTAGMKAHDHTSPFFKRSSTDDYWPTIILNVSDNSKEATTVITFNENMTRGLDVTYDAGMLGGDPDFNLYTRLVEGDNEVNFAIQCLPDRGFEEMVVPLGFDFSKGGEVKFSTEILTLPDGAEALLEDRDMDIFTDLQVDDYVVNVASGNEGAGRFFIHIGMQVTSSGIIGQAKDDVLDIYSYGNKVFIKGMVDQKTEAIVYDIMGRMIKTVRLQPSEMNSFIVDGHESGVYLIRVTGAGIKKTRRLYIE